MRAAVAGALLLVLLGATPAAAQIYRWTDTLGVVHYTTDADSIPEQHRAEVRILDSSRRGEEATPAGPAPVPLGPGEPIMVGALLNGVALSLMLDTGAERTMLSPAVLARAGLDASRGRRVRVIGVTGASEATEVMLPDLEIAGARLGPVAVVAHDVPEAGFDGLLGRDLLHAFTLTADPASGHVILTPR